MGIGWPRGIEPPFYTYRAVVLPLDDGHHVTAT